MISKTMIFARLTCAAFFCLVPVTATAEWPSLQGTAPAAKTGTHDVAVIVAIEDYLLLPDVPGAADNALDWQNFLEQSLGVQTVTTLLNTEATREALLKYAQRAAQEVGPDGTIWWLFIGHGAPAAAGDDGLLVGMDAQQTTESLAQRGVRQEELSEVLSKGRQSRTVLILDACFSGRTESEALAPGTMPVIAVDTLPVTDGRTIILSAAKANEFAGPLPGSSRPAFSYLLLGALRGWAKADDDRVTAGEAIVYARHELRKVKGREQTPQIIGDPDAVLTVGVSEQDPSIERRAECPSGWRWSDAAEACVNTECPDGTSSSERGCTPASSRLHRHPESEEERAADYFARQASIDLFFFSHLGGKHVSRPAFYDRIGRPDLAAKWRPKWRWIAAGGAVISAIGFSGLAINEGVIGDSGVSWAFGLGGVLGAVASGVGLGGMVFGDGVPAAETRTAIDDFNQSLLRELELGAVPVGEE